MRYILVLLLIATTSFSQAGEQQLEIISLQHRIAAELLPTLEPFIDKQGVISAEGSQLIIRTSTENLTELKRLIKQLDRPLRRLLIEVRQPLSGSTEAAQIGISGQITMPDNESSITLRTFGTTSRDTAATDQQIQVLEGHTAIIKTGQQIPMAKKLLRNGRQVETVIEHEDVSSGFQVVPRLSGDGDTVLLEIMPFSADLASSGGGTINRQQAFTSISGKLGEWLEIGGAANRQHQTEQGTLYSTQGRNEAQRQIMIRVTELK